MRTWASLVFSTLFIVSPHSNAAPADKTAPAPSRVESHLVRGIRAAALETHVEFLASDALEGRGTPSKGADAAADYIASRFRTCGLEPAGDTGYFQTATFETVTQPAEGLSLSLHADGQSVTVPRGNLAARAPATAGVEVSQAALYLLDPDQLPATATDETRGRVLVADLAGVQEWTPEQRKSRGRAFADPLAVIARAGAVAMIVNRAGSDIASAVELREASPGSSAGAPPVVNVGDDPFRRLVASWKPGPVPSVTVDLAVPASVIEPAALKNVAGVVRGSDPALRNSYVIVSAHYDHLGIRGDRIMPGANDDASGVAAILEIARAVTSARLRPRRSILFLSFFGEELSGLGSRWYATHPLFPPASTVANVNLEQLGRTDDVDGRRVAELFVTGIDYSDVGSALAQAGAKLGVTVTGRDGDRQFERADNVFLARVGIPAHTVGVTYAFPGRHTADDTPERLDYPNFELVTRAVSLGVWALANDDHEPRWNAAVSAAKPYLEARQKAEP